MQSYSLFPGPHEFKCETIDFGLKRITIRVVGRSLAAPCPECGRSSTKVHSRYLRKLADLPWHDKQVEIHWRSRRFFCGNQICPKRIFTERLPNVTVPHARKTQRLTTALRAIAFSCGGEGGARLARRLQMQASPDTLLRLIRRTPLPQGVSPRILGVDDWAFRRGHRYGTILCDLERRRVVELLPERSSESLRNWLTNHPGVQAISRDRGDYYVKGATEGAPTAIQVADRWHLLRNLREALVRMVDRYPQQVQAAAPALSISQEVQFSEPETRAQTRADRTRKERRDRRLQRYKQVVKFHRQGISDREIARRLGIHRSTVRRFVHAGEFPERAARTYFRQTDPFVDYLRQRWREGCRKAARLTAELKELGFDGSYHMVRRRVAGWRRRTMASSSSAKSMNSASPGRTKRPSSNRVAWLLLKPRTELALSEKAIVKALGERCPQLKTASALAQQFAAILRKKRPKALKPWITRASASQNAIELRRFAEGLIDDLPAVKAAVTLPWSNGQTEGQINRLKLVKRQMFGRANFDLLRQRFLYSAA